MQIQRLTITKSYNLEIILSYDLERVLEQKTKPIASFIQPSDLSFTPKSLASVVRLITKEFSPPFPPVTEENNEQRRLNGQIGEECK